MSLSSPTTDIAVVGAGILGLATAMRLQERHGDLRITVLEAEDAVSRHQSGHNSGVLHSGLYYRPGSNKAIYCRAGKQAREAFCDAHGVPWQRCGKVVVATTEEEVPRLKTIAERAAANGVACEWISPGRLRELEPAAAGLAALHVPETGIVNFRTVCEAMRREIERRSGRVEFRFDVRSIRSQGGSLRLTSGRGQTVEAGYLINCAGLRSDRVCRAAGGRPEVRIVPFRGEYYDLAAESQWLCRNLIYPVPDPAFPFLGVHFTRMIDGGVECGPNAVLALARHGYRWSDVNPGDLAETLRFAGFRKLAAKHWRMGIGEIHRSLSKGAFVRALQKLIPRIQASDLKAGRSGVRAQAIRAGGELIDDFLFDTSDRAIHVLNAPSPAATASIAIAGHIVERFEEIGGR